MTFDDIATGTSVFLDANTFVYAFAPDPILGPACLRLLERIERREVAGITSTHVLSDVAHRLMTIEACSKFGWPYAGIATRLRRHPAEILQLIAFQGAIDAILQLGLKILAANPSLVRVATSVSQQSGILTNDALIVAQMRSEGIRQLASHDADFDRISDVMRFAPL